jgi:myosin heavy subunit
MIPPNPSNQPQDKGKITPTPASNPAPSYQSQPKKSGSPLLPVIITVGLLMLVAVGWLTYNSISTTRSLEQKVAELEEAEKLRLELENQYNQALAELESLKGENAQINALIDQQKAELLAQKDQISGLLRDKRQLDAARAEIQNLKTKVAEYIAQIEQLRAEQEQLAMENTTLKDQTDSLTVTLQVRSQENDELSTAKAQLVNEKEELSKAVQVGSVIKVKNIDVTGLKLRKSGKTAEKDNAKRVDQLKVCFTTVANDVVKPGTEQFFIRIISPKGETLAIDDLGSGAIVNSKTGEEVRYTQLKEYDYANDETQLCFVWAPSTQFQSGKYQVEIYNKGYLAGSGNFELK